jgi:hypothetical protein
VDGTGTVVRGFGRTEAGVLFYFAAREGLLGKKLNKIAVQMIKEKPPEKPEEPEPPKIEPPKVEPPKVETPKIVEAPKVQAPPVVAPPVVAPANSELPSFEFGGGNAVETSSDPVKLYKGYLEYVLRQKWNRPDDEADDTFTAEVAVSVDRQGNIENTTWLKGSGDDKWDATVKQVFAAVKHRHVVVGDRLPVHHQTSFCRLQKPARARHLPFGIL